MQFYVHCVQSACSWESTNISCGGFSSVKCYINVRGWISKEMLAATWETGRIYTTAGLISTWRSCFWCLGIFLITQKNLKQFSVFSWRMKETSQGLWYILCFNEQNRHYSRGQRECTFLTTWRHWSRFFPKVRPFKMDWNAKYSSVRAWLSYLHDLRTFYTTLLRCLDGQRQQPQAQYLTHSFRGTRN